MHIPFWLMHHSNYAQLEGSKVPLGSSPASGATRTSYVYWRRLNSFPIGTPDYENQKSLDSFTLGSLIENSTSTMSGTPYIIVLHESWSDLPC